MKVILQNVRCSYVYINEPRKNSDGTQGKYGLQILLSKDDKEQIEKVKHAVDSVLKSKFGNEALEKKGKYKLPLRDPLDDSKDGDEYKNVLFMNASASRKPGIANKKSEPADKDDIEEYCYSGATFHVSVTFFPFDGKSGSKPGVGVGLNNVMLLKKTPRLDGSISAENEFKTFVEVDDDDEFDDL